LNTPLRERLVSSALLVATTVLLYFALTLPIISFEINGGSIVDVIRGVAPSMDDLTNEDIFLLAEAFLETDLSGYSSLEEYSVIGGANRLWGLENYFPAILIVLFSVVFPIVKLVITWLVAFRGQPQNLNKIMTAAHRVSMLDVFVVSVIVFVISRSAGYEVSFGIGFYVFIAYFFTHLITSAVVARFTSQTAIAEG